MRQRACPWSDVDQDLRHQTSWKGRSIENEKEGNEYTFLLAYVCERIVL